MRAPRPRMQRPRFSAARRGAALALLGAAVACFARGAAFTAPPGAALRAARAVRPSLREDAGACGRPGCGAPSGPGAEAARGVLAALVALAVAAGASPAASAISETSNPLVPAGPGDGIRTTGSSKDVLKPSVFFEQYINWDGEYDDPTAPGCSRKVKQVSPLILKISGQDNKFGTKCNSDIYNGRTGVFAKFQTTGVIAEANKPDVVVDFSTRYKGGPQAIKARYDDGKETDGKIGIVFENGVKWTRKGDLGIEGWFWTPAK